MPRSGYNDEIATLSIKKPDGETKRLYKPSASVFVGDLDLHFDANRLLFSSIDKKNRWQVYEIGIDGKGLRRMTQGEYDDIDNYDARARGTKISRGESWRDRPQRATSSFRLAYQPYQRVYNVGFRVVCDQ